MQLVLDFGLPHSGEKRVTLRKFLLGKHRDAGDFLKGGLFEVTLILGTVLGRALKNIRFCTHNRGKFEFYLLTSRFLGDAVTLKLGAGICVGLDLREEEAVLCFKMGLGLFLKNGLGVFLGALEARIRTGLFLAQAGCTFRLGLLDGDGGFGVLPSPPLVSSLLFSKDLEHENVSRVQ